MLYDNSVKRNHTTDAAYNKIAAIPSMLCAGVVVDDAQTDVGKFARDACNRDLGGSLMCYDKHAQGGAKWIQHGIVSIGRGCGRRNVPGFYVEVNAYGDWIRQVTATEEGGWNAVGPIP